MALDGFINAPKIELTEGLGRLIQGQTRRRLVDEKTAPNGEEWKPNKAGTSILYASGALMRSIDYAATSDYVAVGSGLNYARIHQFGGKIEPKNAKSLRFIGVGGGAVFAKMVQMPARPYIGLSADNAEEIVHTAEAWLARFADPLPRAEPVGNWGSQSVPAAEPVGNW
ncbi:phage virion morphogenesis protein [Candidatus Tokpelaia sp.]|nr:phage virion morphogenesis protein [Candidatus Tokpelaia sp.]